MIKSLLLLIALCCSQAFGLDGVSAIGALSTNPAANAVLVTGSALQSGTSTGAAYMVDVLCTSSVAATCVLQVMNSGTVVQSVYINVPAGASFDWKTAPISFHIPNGFNFRVINATAITGTMQASVFYANDGGY